MKNIDKATYSVVGLSVITAIVCFLFFDGDYVTRSIIAEGIHPTQIEVCLNCSWVVWLNYFTLATTMFLFIGYKTETTSNWDWGKYIYMIFNSVLILKIILVANQ